MEYSASDSVIEPKQINEWYRCKIMIILPAIYLLFFSTLTWSCNQKKLPNPKKEQHASQPASAGRSATAQPNLISSPSSPDLYVAIAGWHSCQKDPRIPEKDNPYGTNLHKNFEKILNLMQSRKNMAQRWLIGCHSSFVNVIYTVSSDQPSLMHTWTHDEFFAYADTMSKSGTNKTYWMGHSYGGYYVMQARLKTRNKIEALITIDAIDVNTCPMEAMAAQLGFKIGDLIFGVGKGTPNVGEGCKQAPASFTSTNLSAIRQSAVYWQNYYQEDLLAVLKSGSISQASCNTKVHHNSAQNGINGHVAMELYESLWRHIVDLISIGGGGTCISSI